MDGRIRRGVLLRPLNDGECTMQSGYFKVSQMGLIVREFAPGHSNLSSPLSIQSGRFREGVDDDI